jgi:hypothetical protein
VQRTLGLTLVAYLAWLPSRDVVLPQGCPCPHWKHGKGLRLSHGLVCSFYANPKAAIAQLKCSARLDGPCSHKEVALKSSSRLLHSRVTLTPDVTISCEWKSSGLQAATCFPSRPS